MLTLRGGASNSNSASSVISEEEKREFDVQGAVCLRGFLEPTLIDLLNRSIDRNIHSKGRYFKDFTAPGTEGRCFEDRICWREFPEYLDILKKSLLGEAAAELLNGKEIRLIEDQYLQHDANAMTPTPWHQDAPFWEIGGRWIVIWIPLDPCNARESLRVVRGSHLASTIYQTKGLRTQLYREHVPNAISPSPKAPDIGKEPPDWYLLSWNLTPGDVIAFNPRTMHSNSGCAGNHRMRRFVARLAAEDAYYHKGNYLHASFIETAVNLRSGDLLRGDDFPLIATRSNA